MAKQEFTSKRDMTYSLKHRTWGDKLYMSDVDYIEFDSNKNPVLMLEEKFKNNYNKNSFSIQCNLEVANRLNIPFFIICFNDDHTQLFIDPVNRIAGECSEAQWITIETWIKFLHKIRGLSI